MKPRVKLNGAGHQSQPASEVRPAVKARRSALVPASGDKQIAFQMDKELDEPTPFLVKTADGRFYLLHSSLTARWRNQPVDALCAAHRAQRQVRNGRFVIAYEAHERVVPLDLRQAARFYVAAKLREMPSELRKEIEIHYRRGAR